MWCRAALWTMLLDIWVSRLSTGGATSTGPLSVSVVVFLEYNRVETPCRLRFVKWKMGITQPRKPKCLQLKFHPFFLTALCLAEKKKMKPRLKKPKNKQKNQRHRKKGWVLDLKWERNIFKKLLFLSRFAGICKSYFHHQCVTMLSWWLLICLQKRNNHREIISDSTRYMVLFPGYQVQTLPPPPPRNRT